MNRLGFLFSNHSYFLLAGCLMFLIGMTFPFANKTLAADQHEKIKTLSSKADKLSMNIPANWHPHPVKEQTEAIRPVFVTLSPDDSANDNFNENCGLIAVDEPTNLNDLLRRPNPGEGFLKNFQSHGKKIVSMSTGQAVHSQHEFTFQEGINLLVIQYSFLRNFAESGNTGFVLTCTALTSTFDRWEPTFNRIAESVTFH